MSDLSEWMARERDRREIEELVKLYFAAVDRGDAALQERIFAPDGRLWIADRLVRGPGADPAGVPWELIRVPAGKIASTHAMQQCVIELGDATARGETTAVSYLAIQGEPKRMQVRGVRYLDRFVKRDGAWRIAERRHCLDWIFEAEATFALAQAERAAFADSGGSRNP